MRTDVEGIVRRLLAEDVFGNGEFLQLADDTSAKVGPQFSSQIQRMVLKVLRPSGETDEFHLVIKLQMLGSGDIEVRDIGCQFSNEVAMYRDIIPFLRTPQEPGRFCPKMFYGRASGGLYLEKDILILEDLLPEGYTTSNHKLFLDFKHIELAMKRLGEFHSWSYRAKKLYPVDFKEKIKLIRVPGFKFNEISQLEYITGIHRAIKPMLERNIETEILNKFLNIMTDRSLVQKLLINPDEPFAIIYHGDFCNNNIFYKYDNEGNPSECALFDFQLSMYGAPAVDLSLYTQVFRILQKNYY